MSVPLEKVERVLAWMAKARWPGVIGVNSKTGAAGRVRHIMGECPHLGVDFYQPTRPSERAYPLCRVCVSRWHTAFGAGEIPFGGRMP